MEIDNLGNSFTNVIINGNSFFTDRIIDLETLVTLRKQNLQYKREDFTYYHFRSNNKIVLAHSIILSIFSLFEAHCTFLCYLCTRTNDNSIKLTPPVIQSLTQYEVDYLNERILKVNSKGETKIQIAYLPIKDKLQSVFIFLGKLHGIHYKLDTSTKYWAWFNELKEFRDSLVHPKYEDSKMFDLTHLKSVNINGSIAQLLGTIVKDSKQLEIPAPLLYRGAASFRWYYRSIYDLYSSILKEYSDGASPFLFPEMFMRDICFTLGAEINMSRSEIDNEFPALGSFQYL